MKNENFSNKIVYRWLVYSQHGCRFQRAKLFPHPNLHFPIFQSFISSTSPLLRRLVFHKLKKREKFVSRLRVGEICASAAAEFWRDFVRFPRKQGDIGGGSPAFGCNVDETLSKQLQALDFLFFSFCEFSRFALSDSFCATVCRMRSSVAFLWSTCSQRAAREIKIESMRGPWWERQGGGERGKDVRERQR